MEGGGAGRDRRGRWKEGREGEREGGRKERTLKEPYFLP